MPSELNAGHKIKFEEAAFEMGPGAQGDFDSPVLRLRYSSLATPSSTIDYDMQTGHRYPLFHHIFCVFKLLCSGISIR